MPTSPTSRVESPPRVDTNLAAVKSSSRPTSPVGPGTRYDRFSYATTRDLRKSPPRATTTVGTTTTTGTTGAQHSSSVMSRQTYSPQAPNRAKHNTPPTRNNSKRSAAAAAAAAVTMDADTEVSPVRTICRSAGREEELRGVLGPTYPSAFEDDVAVEATPTGATADREAALLMGTPELRPADEAADEFLPLPTAVADTSSVRKAGDRAPPQAATSGVAASTGSQPQTSRNRSEPRHASVNATVNTQHTASSSDAASPTTRLFEPKRTATPRRALQTPTKRSVPTPKKTTTSGDTSAQRATATPQRRTMTPRRSVNAPKENSVVTAATAPPLESPAQPAERPVMGGDRFSFLGARRPVASSASSASAPRAHTSSRSTLPTRDHSTPTHHRHSDAPTSKAHQQNRPQPESFHRVDNATNEFHATSNVSTATNQHQEQPSRDLESGSAAEEKWVADERVTAVLASLTSTADDHDDGHAASGDTAAAPQQLHDREKPRYVATSPGRWNRHHPHDYRPSMPADEAAIAPNSSSAHDDNFDVGFGQHSSTPRKRRSCGATGTDADVIAVADTPVPLYASPSEKDQMKMDFTERMRERQLRLKERLELRAVRMERDGMTKRWEETHQSEPIVLITTLGDPRDDAPALVRGITREEFTATVRKTKRRDSKAKKAAADEPELGVPTNARRRSSIVLSPASSPQRRRASSALSLGLSTSGGVPRPLSPKDGASAAMTGSPPTSFALPDSATTDVRRTRADPTAVALGKSSGAFSSSGPGALFSMGAETPRQRRARELLESSKAPTLATERRTTTPRRTALRDKAQMAAEVAAAADSARPKVSVAMKTADDVYAAGRAAHSPSAVLGREEEGQNEDVTVDPKTGRVCTSFALEKVRVKVAKSRAEQRAARAFSEEPTAADSGNAQTVATHRVHSRFASPPLALITALLERGKAEVEGLNAQWDGTAPSTPMNPSTPPQNSTDGHNIVNPTLNLQPQSSGPFAMSATATGDTVAGEGGTRVGVPRISDRASPLLFPPGAVLQRTIVSSPTTDSSPVAHVAAASDNHRAVHEEDAVDAVAVLPSANDLDEGHRRPSAKKDPHHDHHRYDDGGHDDDDAHGGDDDEFGGSGIAAGYARTDDSQSFEAFVAAEQRIADHKAASKQRAAAKAERLLRAHSTSIDHITHHAVSLHDASTSASPPPAVGVTAGVAGGGRGSVTYSSRLEQGGPVATVYTSSPTKNRQLAQAAAAAGQEQAASGGYGLGESHGSGTVVGHANEATGAAGPFGVAPPLPPHRMLGKQRNIVVLPWGVGVAQLRAPREAADDPTEKLWTHFKQRCFADEGFTEAELVALSWPTVKRLADELLAADYVTERERGFTPSGSLLRSATPPSSPLSVGSGNNFNNNGFRPRLGSNASSVGPSGRAPRQADGTVSVVPATVIARVELAWRKRQLDPVNGPEVLSFAALRIPPGQVPSELLVPRDEAPVVTSAHDDDVGMSDSSSSSDESEDNAARMDF